MPWIWVSHPPMKQEGPVSRDSHAYLLCAPAFCCQLPLVPSDLDFFSGLQTKAWKIHWSNVKVNLWNEILLKQRKKGESWELGTWPNKIPPKRKKKNSPLHRKAPSIHRIMLTTDIVGKKQLKSRGGKVACGSSLLPCTNEFLQQGKENSLNCYIRLFQRIDRSNIILDYTPDD